MALSPRNSPPPPIDLEDSPKWMGKISPASAKSTSPTSAGISPLARKRRTFTVVTRRQRETTPKEPKFFYVVNVPIYYDAAHPEVTRATVLNTCTMCLHWQNPHRDVRIIIGLNTRKADVALKTITSFAASFPKRDNVDIIAFQWPNAKNKTEGVNYSAIRNLLFDSYETEKTMCWAVGEATKEGASRPTFVKAVFIDPDSFLTGEQLGRVEERWMMSHELSLMHVAHYRFLIPHSFLITSPSGTIQWSGVLNRLANDYDYLVKEEIGKFILMDYRPLSLQGIQHATQKQLSAHLHILGENLDILKAIVGDDQRHPLYPLWAETTKLFKHMQLHFDYLQVSQAEALMRLEQYRLIGEAIREQEEIHQQTLLEMKKYTGAHILYPSEPATLLTLFDSRYPADLHHTLRMETDREWGIWGNSIAGSGTSEGEHLLSRTSTIMMQRHADQFPIRWIDFESLSPVYTTMPPRYAIKQNNLPLNVRSLIQQYKPQQGFAPAFVDYMVGNMMNTPQSSLNKYFLKHRQIYVETRAPIEADARPAVARRLSSLIPQIQRAGATKLTEHITQVMLWELFLYKIEDKNDPFVQTLNADDKTYFHLFQAIQEVLVPLFASKKDPSIATLGYLTP